VLVLVLSQELDAQWGPLPVREGAMLLYSAGPKTFTDSVLVVSDTQVAFRRREYDGGRLRSSVIRRYVRRPSGILLLDQTGDQLVFPAQWPPVASWSYVKQGATFRFVPLRDTIWVVEAKMWPAHIVQLTVEKGSYKALYNYVIADGIGVTRVRTIPNPTQADYELTAFRLPRDPIIASAGDPAPSVVYRPPTSSVRDSATRNRRQQLGTPRPTFGYFGGSLWGGGTARVDRQSSVENVADGSAFGLLELGGEGKTSVRLRYAWGTEAADPEVEVAEFELGMIDVLYDEQVSTRAGMYLGAGASWARLRQPVRTKYFPGFSASFGVRVGTNAAFTVEVMYVSAGIPRTVRDFGGSTSIRVGDGIFLGIGLRSYGDQKKR
jgi:hypothetical protein